jgi:hypothetical protein
MGGEAGVHVSGWFRREYGDGPVHLMAVIASFSVAAYALSRVFDEVSDPTRVLLWLGGAIVAHDLVLLPLYSLLGVIASKAVVPEGARRSLRIAALNHLRVPALLSGLMLLVWYPLVAGKGESSYTRAAGLSNDVYLERWLLLTAALFLGSALLFALRVRRLARADLTS